MLRGRYRPFPVLLSRRSVYAYYDIRNIEWLSLEMLSKNECALEISYRHIRTFFCSITVMPSKTEGSMYELIKLVQHLGWEKHASGIPNK